THLNGGAIMGTDPKTSTLNRYLQSWDVPNLFVLGASAFPQNAGYNPTGTVGALASWAAAAIRDQYLKNPGPLVHAYARKIDTLGERRRGENHRGGRLLRPNAFRRAKLRADRKGPLSHFGRRLRRLPH